MRTNRGDETSRIETRTDRRGGPRGSAVLLRSHDHQWGYDLDVEVRTPAGEPAHAARVYLQPGDVRSVGSALPPGEYVVAVTLDNDRERTCRCRLDEAPEHTAVVEVGNGAVSLTEGV